MAGRKPTRESVEAQIAKAEKGISRRKSLNETEAQKVKDLKKKLSKIK